MLNVSEARLEFVRFPLVNYRCIGIDKGAGRWSFAQVNLRIVVSSLLLLATTSAFRLVNMSLMTIRGETVELKGVFSNL
jgi:hypothetical protein